MALRTRLQRGIQQPVAMIPTVKHSSQAFLPRYALAATARAVIGLSERMLIPLKPSLFTPCVARALTRAKMEPDEARR